MRLKGLRNVLLRFDSEAGKALTGVSHPTPKGGGFRSATNDEERRKHKNGDYRTSKDGLRAR